ncbi:uncharacterized protein LOC134214662 isoform X1 [Armigeres subalbatus]|uniref:uncharacterized protein LOC134214662 isoform X1 n=1 Tax=Armigeres subalbatus TaxID=124917 RepID=UPI002ED2C02D
MTSVTVVAVVLLGLQLWGCSHAITVYSDKKVSASEKERKTESLTFSANGEDQLIFSDTRFPVRNGEIGKASGAIRRVIDTDGAEEFFESGWRPVSGSDLQQLLRKLSDQIPHESVHKARMVAQPWNKTTRFIRFSESDTMRNPAFIPTTMKTTIPSSNNVIFKDISSEEELSYEDSFEGLNVGEVNLVKNHITITPRMFKFDENDGMKFKDDSPESFETSQGQSESNIEESKESANYEVYVLENLLKKSNSSFQVDDTINDISSNTQSRILQPENNIPNSDNKFPVPSRNVSRFFRFDETDTVPETNRVSTFKFQENHSSRDDFKFPRNDETSSRDIYRNTGEPFKFRETDSRPQNSVSSPMRFEQTVSEPPRFFHGDQSSPQSSSDQFYTVNAMIQIDGSDNAVITPPTVPIATRRPKKKKGKIYSQNGFEHRKQDGFNYQYPQDYGNYLQGDQQLSPNQYQPPSSQYQGNYQIPPTPQNIPISNYYQNLGPANPGTPFDPNSYYIQNYLANYPYPQQPQAEASASYPAIYPQQQNVPTNLINGGQSDSPISAQSVLGFLQSIFNFAPGTFGNSGPTQPGLPPSGFGGAPAQQHYPVPSGSASPIVAASSQLRKALDNIAENDELQCVPKLICMMSRRSSGQGFGTYVNRGLLSTVLSAVPDSSPWLKFSRAALLGYGIGANSCDVYYPKCPKDEPEIIHYLNNHRGGFFRFFNDDHKNSSSG